MILIVGELLAHALRTDAIVLDRREFRDVLLLHAGDSHQAVLVATMSPGRSVGSVVDVDVRQAEASWPLQVQPATSCLR